MGGVAVVVAVGGGVAAVVAVGVVVVVVVVVVVGVAVAVAAVVGVGGKMKKVLASLLLVTMLGANAHAVEASEVAADSLLMIDCLQTWDIKRHKGMYETNPILGEHPSNAKVAGYFAAAMFGIHYIPKEYQWAVAAIELSVILRNRKIGLEVKF